MFAQNGYETVSVSRIAGELGMTKGALYRRYQNKREIRSDRQENGTEGQ
ncbi:helix-turn-helix domain-containing protein [Mediterraneibacter butyricigenes]|nr:helix-turn-helix domain-containing protein [Mediterraneibacter butyricigenes]